MRTFSLLVAAVAMWAAVPASAQSAEGKKNDAVLGRTAAADSCKECQEFLKACSQAHSKAACQTDYNICKKHCKDK